MRPRSVRSYFPLGPLREPESGHTNVIKVLTPLSLQGRQETLPLELASSEIGGQTEDVVSATLSGLDRTWTSGGYAYQGILLFLVEAS